MAEPKKAAGGRLFHVLHGESPFMYEVDRQNALNLHPAEWKDRPWTEEEIEAYKRGPEPTEPEPTEPTEPEPETEAEHDDTHSRRRGGRSRK